MWAWALPAWTWLKKWWRWLVLPIGAALWLLGRMTAKKTVVVVSPELADFGKLAAQAEAQAAGRLQAAEALRVKKIDHANQSYDDVIQRMDEADERRKKALEGDPIALNRFLKEVGARADKG